MSNHRPGSVKRCAAGTCQHTCPASTTGKACLVPAGAIDHVVSVGDSQSGNFIRTFIHLGFNQDERDRIVWDGAFPRIAARRSPNCDDRNTARPSDSEPRRVSRPAISSNVAT